jgi:DNA end-binding protein Ku
VAIRALDKVTIGFGLVSIPTKIYSTNAPSEAISFHLLHAECGTRIKQQLWCPRHEQVVTRDEIVKGYEYARGRFVELTDDELDALEAAASNTIAIQEFVPIAAVDPIYVERSYYLGPDQGGERAYALLARAMIAAELGAIASYAARGKSYVVLVRPFEDGLIMHQLRYPDEIKPWDEVPIPARPHLKTTELELARQVIQQITSTQFRPENYRDEVKDRMRAAIEEKLEGGEIVLPEPAPRAAVVDLMDALKASLGGDGEPAPTRRAARGHRSRAAARARPAPRRGGARSTRRAARK